MTREFQKQVESCHRVQVSTTHVNVVVLVISLMRVVSMNQPTSGSLSLAPKVSFTPEHF